MKTTLSCVIFCMLAFQMQAQTFGNVYEQSNPSDLDKVNWDLTNSQLLNLRIELKGASVPDNLKVNVVDLSTKVPLTFEMDQSQSGDVIKGKLIINKDTRLGVKTISLLVNDTPFIKTSKNFLLYSTKVPSLASPSAITQIVFNEAEVTLRMQNILNFRTLFIADQNGTRADLFDINIIETDVSNKTLKIKVFCPDASYISPNYFVWLVDNNERNNLRRSLRTDQIFSFSSTTRRFDLLEFYRGDKAAIVIPNVSHPLSTQATYTLVGLNQSSIELAFDGSHLRSGEKINIQNANEDCVILENGVDGQRYRIKIRVKEIPKIAEGSMQWSEVSNTTLENGPYVDHSLDKTYKVVFTGLGLDGISANASQILFEGSPNAIKFTAISQQDGSFRGDIQIPKATKPGRYVIKYPVDNRSFDLHSIVVHELTASNTNMPVSASFNRSKTFDLLNPEVFVENKEWDEVNRFISFEIQNNNDKGAQLIDLSVNIKNEKGITIAQYSESHAIAEDETKTIKPDVQAYEWIDASSGEVKGWYVYEVQVRWRGAGSSTPSLSRSSRFILKGNDRAFVTPQLSIPFSQTVFIFEDSLKAAPYNIGLNLNFRYRSITDAFKISPVYWGTGFYFSQNDLLDEQAMQFGIVGYIGVVYPTNATSNQFHISLGFGPNVNIKFKEDANRDDTWAAAMVLNIGYNFGSF